MDPSMRLFEYDDKSLLASIPTMLSFPKVGSSVRRVGVLSHVSRSCMTCTTRGGRRRLLAAT